MSQIELYGRKAEDGKLQLLRDHLLGAGKLAQSFEEEYSSLAYAAAALHDIGKVTDDFQEYLINNKGKRGSVRHAIHGARFAWTSGPQQSKSERAANAVLALAIAKHHGALPDCLFDNTDNNGAHDVFEVFSDKVPEDDAHNFEEVKSRLCNLDIDFTEILNQASSGITQFEDILNQHKGMRQSKDQMCFHYGLFLKYIYSRLIDADRLDAAAFTMSEKQKENYYTKSTPDWGKYIDKLAQFTQNFDTTSHINQIRSSIFQQCQEASSRQPGIYQLAVPTGGGKTLASLNFALHHAQQWKKRRIIYVIPYLSITTQTAQVFRSVFDLSPENSVLLEHYSSAHSYKETSKNKQDQDTGNDESLLEKLAAERWNSPFIVTTMVQFLETVMAAKGTKLRKFHNMADSVIIFDEIQALPVNTINLFNEVVSFLANMLGTTIVLCSATQPHLHQTERKNLELSPDSNLVQLSNNDQDAFRRTQIFTSPNQCSLEEMAEHVLNSARTYGNCLAVVNLKNEAKKIVEYLRAAHADDEFEIIHLSTSMCNKHRADKLAFLAEKLASSHPNVICVSTQLIEAGVDISFRSVVRAMAGLDSIIQAAGRCNRNGESESAAPVFVDNIRDENLNNLYTIKKGKDITAYIVREHPDIDLLSDKAITLYYNILFNSQSALGIGSNIMDYQLRDKSNHIVGRAYTVLGFNKSGRNQYLNTFGREYRKLFAQSFATVDEKFHVIDNAGQSIVVPYQAPGEESCKPLELLEQLSRSSDDNNAEKLSILNQLRPYTVTLFDYEIKKLTDENAIDSVKLTSYGDFSIRYIDSTHYSDDVGVTYEITDDEEILSY